MYITRLFFKSRAGVCVRRETALYDDEDGGVRSIIIIIILLLDFITIPEARI